MSKVNFNSARVYFAGQEKIKNNEYFGLRKGNKCIEVKVFKHNKPAWRFVGKFFDEESFKKYLDKTVRYSKNIEFQKLSRKVINQIKICQKSREMKIVDETTSDECSICKTSLNQEDKLQFSRTKTHIICKNCVQNLTENCKNILNRIFVSSTESTSPKQANPSILDQMISNGTTFLTG
jgi:hypothetical protein